MSSVKIPGWSVMGPVITQFLLVLTLLVFSISRTEGAPVFLFWFLIIGLALHTLSFAKKEWKIYAIVLAEIGLTFVSVFTYADIWNLERDEIFESQLAEIFAEEGLWDPTLGAGFAENYYGYNPVMHLTLAFLSEATGLSPFFLSKYIFIFMLRVVFVLGVYAIIKNLVKDPEHAFISMVIFLFSPRLFFMSISRRFIAAIIVIFALIIMIRYFREHKRRLLMMLYIISPLIVLADHSVSYLYAIFIGGSILFVRDKGHQLIYLAYYMSLIMLWNYGFAHVLVEKDLAYLVGVLASFLTGSSEVIGETVHINTWFETALVISSQIGLLLLSLYSIYHILRTRAHSFLGYLTLIGLGGYCISIVLLSTSWVVIAHIVFWLVSLPIILHATQTVMLLKDDTYLRYVLAGLFIIYVAGSVTLGYGAALASRDAPVVLEFRDVKDEALYASAVWLAEHDRTDAFILGDITVFDIYGGHFRYHVLTEGFARDFFSLSDPKSINNFLSEAYTFGYYQHTEKTDKIEYIVVYDDMYRLESFLLGQPLSDQYRSTLEESSVELVYDNGEVQIYRNEAYTLA
ncbi:hypothetical protein H6504_04495 [Candidatus Woesearchaeota archaeon]|nr:hypothetical protein [Candidatus Woesearchaeota archaeon]